MRKFVNLLSDIISFTLIFTVAAFAQAPQIPLTGNIGVQGSVAVLGGVTVQMPADANYTLTPAQWANKTIVITSAVSLSATRSIIAPLNKGQEYNVENNTTGGHSITLIGASGTGVTVAAGASTSVFSDGTNYIQVSGISPVSSVFGRTGPVVSANGDYNFGQISGIASPAQLALIPGVAGPNYYFGDSLTSPSGITDSGTIRQMAMRLGADMLGQKYSTAFSGQETDQITTQVLGNFPVVFNTTSYLPKVWYEAGVNNALDETVTTGSINNFSLEYATAIAWVEVPLANRVYASAATSTGTWAANGLLLLDASNTGAARLSTTNNSTLSFSLPSAGTFAGITYYAPSTANGGTFTFAIDGVLQTDVCSGTTTFSNTGCNGVAVINGQAAFHQQFPVSVGTHIALVTVTSATSASNVVYILAADISPVTKVGLPPFLASGVLRQQGDAMSASTAAFDAAQAAVIAAYSPWANVLRIDVRNGNPGVNTTTDFAVTAGCPGGVPPVHPTSCGYEHYVQTVENGAAVAGLNIFYPGLGVNQNTSLTGFTSLGPVSTGDVATGTFGNFQVKSLSVGTSIVSANPNVFNNGVPSLTNFAQLNCYFTITTGNPACQGITWNPITSHFMDALISTYDMGFQHCTSSTATTGPGGCRIDFYTDSNSGQGIFPNGLQSALYANTAAQTVVNCSTSGTATFSQPEQGASYKKVIIYLNACLGTAVYTFPVPFLFTPQILSQSLTADLSLLGAANTTVSTSTSTTGFISLEGY